MLKASRFKFVYLIFCLITSIVTLVAQTNDSDKHTLNAMRIIGHELLLDASDSTSRVLPVIKQSNTYTIQFATEFQFLPKQLFETIDSVIKATNIASRYIVEVEVCTTKEIIYSYEAGRSTLAEMIPCAFREPEKACYSVAITILETNVATTSDIKKPYLSIQFWIPGIAVVIIAAVLVIALFRRRKQEEVIKTNGHAILIGAYKFDPVNSVLLTQQGKVSFSAKESELLQLLNKNANTTIEREVILKTVWGDDGDYIGRTLDVFISKLRKKLEANTNLKIVNIRGVGYKLIIA
ncbi:MAG TPA: winged helix-turn-helix domain-containing protein [Chitinophagales bacterium]|nr:winged helix-turn-helix domain-containing protein [Chitinophagales bacterium]HRH54149.1 winged helix-turn-helix domain-containing protein [Chitinophagales bacterium]